MSSIVGNIIDIRNRRIYPGRITFDNGHITEVTETPDQRHEGYILPGFIDAHVHVESSMLAPSEFARMAVVHGTVATVSDPHEIANVLGMEGVRFMIRNGKEVPFHFAFGAPSCVPATSFETAGAILGPTDIRELLEEDGLKYLSEMMNFPGVLHNQPDVLEKIAIAKSLGRPVDGHAPGLMGEDARHYIQAGITTDHECFSLEEAIGKLQLGMKILIREGSAAKNFEALHSILSVHHDRVMLCSDDKHPHELVRGHINELVRRAVIEKGHDLFNVLQAACLNPIDHYDLDVGSLRLGDSADFIILEDLHDFKARQTYILGQLVASYGKSLIPRVPVATINQFHTDLKKPEDFIVRPQGPNLRVIEVLDGQLVTVEGLAIPRIEDNNIVSDTSTDVLKLVVVNRYKNAPIAVGFVRNVGLKKGALASSISHDSHNIVAVGCSDAEICQAVNAIIEHQGGISVASDGKTEVLELPLAGIMSPDDGWSVAKRYESIDQHAKELGTLLHAPFMSLSFLALLVIPSLKLGDRGLFDVNQFTFTPLTF